MRTGRTRFTVAFEVAFVVAYAPFLSTLKCCDRADSALTCQTQSVPVHPEFDYEVEPNPDVNPVLGFTVISDDNLLAYTRTSILHFDGKGWSVLYRTEDHQIDCMSTDGKYVAFSLEMMRFGASMTIAPLYVGILRKRFGRYDLDDLSSFNVPLGHSLNDIRFTGHGVGFATAIFEYVYFTIQKNPAGHLTIHFTPHSLHVGLNSGGAMFGTGAFRRQLPVVAINEGALVEAHGETLHVVPLLDIYSDDLQSFESNETLMGCSMFDSGGVFFLSNESLFIVSKEISGGYRVYRENELSVGNRSIPVKEVSSILAMNDTDIYALTETGLLLKGEYSEKTGRISGWTVAAILPIYSKGVIARLNQNTILVGGTSLVEYFVGSAGSSTIVSKRKEKVSCATRFSVSMFDAGTTYGVGIGKLDMGSLDSYIYLVELSGQNKLYVDRKGATFPGNTFDIADQCGVTGRTVEPKLYQSSFGIGVAIGDINEDGSDDIIVSYLSGPPAVLVNNGAGYFRNETNESGLNTDLMRTEGITLADVNNDGYLDLFATSFVGSDRLFVNEGGGRFKDVTKQCGVASKGKSITAVFGDLNGDGYPDIYVGRWNADNSLYLNNGDGTFRDITSESGAGCGELHETNSVLLADFNNDGKLDIFVGNREGGNKLFLNDGNGHFKDVSKESGLADTMYTYGSAFGDFEDDGRLDLIVAGLTTVKFYKNVGNDNNGVPIFKDESSKFLPPSSDYNGYNTGVATYDADGNGDLDAIVGQFQGHTMFIKNNINAFSGKHDNFIEVNVEGDESNRDGVGAKVELLKNGKMAAYREVMSTYGYASSSSRTQLFGITDPDAHYQVEVDFPVSGIKRVITAVPGTLLTVYEHDGIQRDYFLLRKDLTGLFMSGRFRTAVAESFLVIFLVLMLLTMNIPYLGSTRVLRTAKEKYIASVYALLVFVVMEAGIYASEQISSSRNSWITGPHDIVRDNLLPILLTLIVMIAFLKSKKKSENAHALRREAYGRLYALLRKFEHGEGSVVVLNRLALFVENLKCIAEEDTGQIEEKSDNPMVSIDREAESGITDPKMRFHAVLDEYAESVHKEIGCIIGAIESIIDSNAHDNKLRFLQPTVETLKESSEDLLQNVKALKSLLIGKSEVSKSDGRMRADTVKEISSIKSSLAGLRKVFEKEFIAEIGRIVAEEVAKFRGEYRDFVFKYEDKSTGVRGIISEGELREIVSILIRNSVQAVSPLDSSEENRTISVRTLSTPTSVIIEEEDNGPGISSNDRSQIFSGEFTTKGSGHGFGLQHAMSCLSKYGGEIHLDDSHAGAKFVVKIEKAV